MISKNTQILHLAIKRPLFDHHFWNFLCEKNDLFDFKSVGRVVDYSCCRSFVWKMSSQLLLLSANGSDCRSK